MIYVLDLYALILTNAIFSDGDGIASIQVLCNNTFTALNVFFFVQKKECLWGKGGGGEGDKPQPGPRKGQVKGEV